MARPEPPVQEVEDPFRVSRQRAFPHGQGPWSGLRHTGLRRLKHLSWEIRSPKVGAWYGDLDPRSWLVLATLVRRGDLDLASARAAANILGTARRAGRCLCTLPRSGTNWTSALLTTALNLSRGASAEFRYEEGVTYSGQGEWVHEGGRYGWPALPSSLAWDVRRRPAPPSPDGLFLVAHHPIDRAMFDVSRMRPVVIIRNPRDALRSYIQLMGVERAVDDERFRQQALSKTVRFLNFWGDQLDRQDTARPLLVRYEDLRSDAVDAVLRISVHWDLRLSSAVVEEAVQRCSMGVMAEKTGFDATNVRVRVGVQQSLPHVLEEAVSAILVSGDLRQTFGYDMDADGMRIPL